MESILFLSSFLIQENILPPKPADVAATLITALYTNVSGGVLEVQHTGFPGAPVVKNPPAGAGDEGSVSGSGRSPGAGNGNPLQCSCLQNPTGRGAWRAAAQGVTGSHGGSPGAFQAGGRELT